MGFLSYLERTISSFIRPWILQKDVLQLVSLHIHLSQLVLELQPLDVDCNAINSSSLLTSSPFVLSHACVNQAKLTISLFRSPGVLLEVRGLHSVFHIRHPNDPFWCSNKKGKALNGKKEAIDELDPQGAAVHIAAERNLKERTNKIVVRTFLLSFVLQVLGVELDNATVEFQTDGITGSSHNYHLHLDHLLLEEGKCIAGNVVRRLANVIKQVDERLCKLCYIQKFGLLLATQAREQVQTADTANTLDEHSAHRWVSKGYVLLWKKASFVLEMQNDHLAHMEAFFTETMIQLSLTQLEGFLTDASQLQEFSRTTVVADEQDSGTRGQYLWQRAFEKITDRSWKRLRNVVEAGVLRQRYTRLYVSWLLKAGEGLFDELISPNFRKALQREKLDLKLLETDLFGLEQQLPVEAIVLARSLARNRLFEAAQRHGLTARPVSFVLWRRARLCLAPACGALKKAGIFLITIFKSTFYLLYICFKQVFTSLGGYWLYLKFWHFPTALRNMFPSLADYFVSDSKKEHPQILVGYPEFSRERKYIRGRDYDGGVSSSITFHTGSITILPLSGGTKGSVASSEETMATGLQFSWGNVSMVYLLIADVMNVDFVFGYFQGGLFTFPASSLNKEVPMTSADCQGWSLSEKTDIDKFIQSGPAPQISIPQMVHEYIEPGHSGLSVFMEFISRGNGNLSDKVHENCTRPFLLFSLQETQTGSITYDNLSNMILCNIAVGSLDCNLDMCTLMQLGQLLTQFAGIVSVYEDATNDAAYQINAITSNITRTEWEVLYADRLKQITSSIVLKRKIWLLTAVECSKLQFSCLCAEGKDNGADSGVDKEPMVVLCLGHMEAIVWPARVDQDNPNLGGDFRPTSNEARKPMVWVKRPPRPHIQGDTIVESSSQHDCIGNNGLVSVKGAALALQAVQGSKGFSLVGPLTMTWEFSLCRDHFLSPFGVCDVVSAAASGLFSGIPAGIFMEDLRTFYKVSNTYKAALEKLSQVKGSHTADNQRVVSKGDASPSYSLILSQGKPLYYALSVELQVDELDCIITEKRVMKDGKEKNKVSSKENFYILDRSQLNDIQGGRFNWLDSVGVHGSMDHAYVKELWFNFSWGDGCPLMSSSGLGDVRLLITKIQNGASMGDSKERDLFKLSTDRKSRLISGIGQCELSLQRLSLKLEQPWCLSETSDDIGGALKTLVGFQAEKLHLTAGASDNLINKALSRVTSTTRLSIDIAVFNDLQNISIVSQGGLLVVHTEAMILLLQEWQNIFPAYSEVETGSLPAMNHNVKGIEKSPASLGKSSSLPNQAIQTQQTKYQRLYSAPIDLSVAKQEMCLNNSSWRPKSLSMELIGLKILVAQSNSTPLANEAEGFLLEVGAILNVQRSMTKETIYFETKRLSVCSLQISQSGYARQGRGRVSQIPTFGSMTLLAAGSACPVDVRESFNSSNGPPHFANREATFANTDVLMLKNPSSSMEGLSRERVDDFILENLSIMLSMEYNPGCLDQSAISDGWRGSCSFLDIDVALTTSEIQLLVALFSSLSNLSLRQKNDLVNTHRESQITNREEISDHAFDVHDGAIVALKDVQEHLYVAVEMADNGYRLVGVLHHSLVGDRALFKVKYQKGSRDSSKQWFSLLSLVAKTADGEPLRIHYRPGSGLADISSTHDGSWELWKTHPYKYSAREDDGDLDLYNDLNNSLVYLINQRSKQGLALASGSPMMVKKPGSPFKFKVVRSVKGMTSTLTRLDMTALNNDAQHRLSHPPSVLAALPKIEIKMGKVYLTVLYETGGGKHLLPLLRGRLEDAGAVMHINSRKIRLIGDCKLVFEYLEAHMDKWSSIIQPVEMVLFYRLRTHTEARDKRVKLPTSFFMRCKKVDISINEASLDMILFVIGILNLAGPYTIKHSPVLATSCMVENQTGLELFCSFDAKDLKAVLTIPAWEREAFFVRNMISRRDLSPAKVLSSISLYLKKESVGQSSPIHTSLAQPSVFAVRTHLERKTGHKRSSGPIIVIDVSKQSEDGIIVTVSPMIRIQNNSGVPLELRCRRPNSDSEGAVVLLKDGDMVDDSLGAFDALNLEGELRKALSSFNLGDYLLSVRPKASVSPSYLGLANDYSDISQFDWSEDIKGEKPIRVSGFFEKLQYGLKKSMKGPKASHTFGTVFCAASPCQSGNGSLLSSPGVHILIRSTSRYVPLLAQKSNDKNETTNHSVIAWQEQKELVLLPTLHIHNFLDSQISLTCANVEGTSDKEHASEMCIGQSCKVSMYADLAELGFVVKVDKLKITSTYVSIGEWGKSLERSSSSAPADRLSELEMDLDFRDKYHYAKLKLFRANDGVLQVLVYTQYAMMNMSDISLSFYVPVQSRYFWGMVPWNRKSKMWPSGDNGTVLQAGVKTSLLSRSSILLLQVAGGLSQTSSLDLDSFSGSTELSLNACHENDIIENIPLGVRMEMTEAGSIDPTRTIGMGSRYIAFNESSEAVFVCQDGYQEDESAAFLLKAAEPVSLRIRYPAGQGSDILGRSQLLGVDLRNPFTYSVRFRLSENGWDWTGPVCASALGTFSLRIHRKFESLQNIQALAEIENKARFKFVAVDVEEESPSLVVRFRMQSADTVPYRIENTLPLASIFFYQKGLDEVVTKLEAGQVIGYAWDDLSRPHKLVVSVPGTNLCKEVKLDKLSAWKSFGSARQKKGFGGLLLSLGNQAERTMQYDANSTEPPFTVDSCVVGYEVGADGAQRVLRICEDSSSSRSNRWQSHIAYPSARIDLRIPVFEITLFENEKQKRIEPAPEEASNDMSRLSPIISMRIGSLFLELLNTQKHFLFQLKVQTLSIDEKWQGAPFAAMVRVHSEDRFKKGETVLHIAAIVSNQAFDPIHVKYSSILLQAIDVNLDEETLMKFVPFYRYSLAESTSSQQLYFERLEIHPIKILASFLPGQPLTDYTSAQEAFRTLLHSFIKVPSIRGATVELNGVLLSHALLTFRQLAIKCAQHYSWYAMRAIYIAKGSKLLPPAFSSLFDDSAASSLDVFFDPSNGSIDLQGLTLGMFNLLSEGLNKRGLSGTSRYIGDLERKMKAAGSNILFAVLTEVSDNVLKGAETGGLDGMVNGFRRGILNVSMEPSLLRTAIVKGGSSRRIKLDHSPGTDESYVEGYLQAMLDTLYKQNYMKVKVVDDQVLLKNLPPSSILIDEIMGSVKDFLVREGLLAGETSAGALHSWRRLQGENDKRIVPAVVALCEQLFVIFAVRALRNQARSWFHWGVGSSGRATVPGRPSNKEDNTTEDRPEPEGGHVIKRSMKGIMLNFVLSSAMAYIDGRLCRHIPNTVVRRIVSGFLLSFVE